MTCQKALSLITPFIDDQLDMEELEEFVDHVNSCAECREELEVYYALLTAMKQLDEDRALSDNYSKELAIKLEKSMENIIHVKYARYRKKGLLVFLFIIMVFLLSLQYNRHENGKENTVTDSNFQLRVSFHQRKFDELELELQKYLGKEYSP